MADQNSNPSPGSSRRILIRRNGPYIVQGELPLVRKTQVVSEHGEPLTWQTEGSIPVSEGEYRLCRCGLSEQFPFCDGTHDRSGFDGEETADTGTFEKRAIILPGGVRILVKKDNSLCMNSGFCELRDASLEELVASTQDSRVRSLVMRMVEHCPAGALTYRIQADSPEIEPDLPQQVATTVEITSNGPIEGPLWVSGSLPIQRSDGQPLETRNRVTLCNCGLSCNKPLCDGMHREMAEREPGFRKVTPK